MANSENFTHPQSRFQTILLNKQNCSLPSLQSTFFAVHYETAQEWLVGFNLN